MTPHPYDPPPPRPPPARRAIRRVLLTLSLLSLAAPLDTGAQQIRGRLLDVVSERPVPAGLVRLLGADSSVVAVTVTAADGSWRFDVPRAGLYYVAAERLGYQPWIAGPVAIGEKDELDSVFHLQPLPVRLDAIQVQAAAVRRYLEYNGFFERQRGDFGHFVTPEAIERRQAVRVTDLLSAIPGVQRVAAAGGSAGPVQIQLRGSSLSQGGFCRPRVFVDGLMYSRGDSRPVRLSDADATEQAADDAQRRLDQSLSLDDIGHPSSIAAIEVYRSSSQVPVRFGGTSVETLCGVIVVWTRSGRMRANAR